MMTSSELARQRRQMQQRIRRLLALRRLDAALPILPRPRPGEPAED